LLCRGTQSTLTLKLEKVTQASAGNLEEIPADIRAHFSSLARNFSPSETGLRKRSQEGP